MRTYLTIIYSMVGLVTGSFLNVVIDRVPAGESLIRPPSHCPSCGRKLSPLELIPVLSYIALGGRCRVCDSSIPLRILVVEAVTGLLFAFLYWVYGPNLQLLLITIYTCVLVAVLFIDLEHMLIPNVIILPATAFALLMTPFQRLPSRPLARDLVLRLLQNLRARIGLPLSQLNMLRHLAGGLVGFLVFFAIWFVSLRLVGVDAMGFGDVKLAVFCGLVTAFPDVLLAVFGSFVLGGLIGAVLLVSGVADRKTPIPFAPFLVVTTFVVMVFGESLLLFFL